MQLASTLGFILNKRSGKFLGLTPDEQAALHECLTWAWDFLIHHAWFPVMVSGRDVCAGVVGSLGGCVAPETMFIASTGTSWRTLTPAAGA